MTNKKQNHLFGNCKYFFGEVDYETHNNCDEFCDPYCRCGKIYNAKMIQINYHTIAEEILDYLDCKDENIFYPLSKYVEKIVTSDDFEILIDHGYYGEEIGEVIFDTSAANKLIEYAKTLMNKNPETLITEGLLQEHGYLLNRHNYVTSVINHKMKLLPFLDKIIITNKNPDKEKIRRLYMDNIFEGFIVINDNGKFKLIDGHHRFQALLNKLLDNGIYSPTFPEVYNALPDIIKRLKKSKKEISFKEIVIENPIEELKEKIEILEDKVEEILERLKDAEGRDYH